MSTTANNSNNDATADDPIGATATSSLHIDERLIGIFAEVTKDQNPLHLDEEFAKQTRYDGQIAHGWLVGSQISAALADLPGLVSWREVNNLTFEEPVRPGETVTAEVEVLERVSESLPFYSVHAHVEVDDEVVIDSTHTMLIEDLDIDVGGEA